MNTRSADKFRLDSTSDSAIRLLPENGIGFDAKGNAVYQGSLQHLLRSPLLEQPLSLESDPLTTLVNSTPGTGTNTVNTGYNPYAHQAQRSNTARMRKVDMRELSKWIEMKKRLEIERK